MEINLHRPIVYVEFFFNIAHWRPKRKLQYKYSSDEEGEGEEDEKPKTKSSPPTEGKKRMKTLLGT
jgi:hypothetical protein